MARPFAETGFQDDWSYKQIAQAYLKDGKFTYNGWANAMLGWQVPYGAMFMRWLGPTFLAVRASTVLTAAISVVLFRVCASRAGIRNWNAVVGAIVLGLSPMFLLLAASYMTDISSLLVVLVCLFLCLCAVRARTHLATCGWLITATITNLALGTVRQVTWLGLLVMVPSTAWLLRKRRGVLPVAVMCWLAGAGGVLVCMRWFWQQPYAVPEQLFTFASGPHQRIGAHAMLRLCRQMLTAALCLCFLCLPLLAAWLVRLRSLRAPQRATFWKLVAIALVGTALAARFAPDYAFVPWLQQVLDSEGVWPLIETSGSYVPTLGLVPRALVSIVVLIAVAAFAVQMKWQRWKLLSVVDESLDPQSRTLTAAAMAWILLPFVAAYTVLLLPRAYTGNVFDRYLLTILPVVLLLLLRAYQDDFGNARVPLITPVLVAVLAAYATAAVHDSYAALRAEMEFTRQMAERGIPRQAIDEGWISNAQEQLELAGHIDNPFLRLPRSVPPALVDLRVPAQCRGWFPITAFQPTYFMTWSPVPACYRDTGIPPVTFSTWLAPHQHTLYAQQLR